ncbi:hypothetical protein [Pseudoalteromonas sp. MMG024]|uniref:hypothetical protein n=1 Tax=Pseudoalteromonas sp. MMG024 TaxID=2909980 RepID=UPI001F459908|nr:hypothetical protein [Pseudoalteromonas sp. MMG024]MCF6459067.1 hypothetical protein [Pseudoalteromonas sp. MMG024]
MRNHNYTQGAVVLCQKPKFWQFLALINQEPVETEQQAAQVVRDYCGIQSRAELNRDSGARGCFEMLVEQFNTWANRPH